MSVKPIPEGYHTLTPYMVVRDAQRAIEFYQQAFGAQVLDLLPSPDGKIMHAALKIGDSPLMLNDEFPEYGAIGPQTLGGTAVTIHLYTEDCDAAYKQAVTAGAQSVMEPNDAFWGDRFAMVVDPFGHKWSIATHIKDMTPEETVDASKKAFGGGQCES